MLENNLIIYVQVVFIFWIKTDEVQIAMTTRQCGFHPLDDNR